MTKAGHQTERVFITCCTKTQDPLVGKTSATGRKCDMRDVNGVVDIGMGVVLDDAVGGVDDDELEGIGEGGTHMTFRRKSYQPIVLAP